MQPNRPQLAPLLGAAATDERPRGARLGLRPAPSRAIRGTPSPRHIFGCPGIPAQLGAVGGLSGQRCRRNEQMNTCPLHPSAAQNPALPQCRAQIWLRPGPVQVPRRCGQDSFSHRLPLHKTKRRRNAARRSGCTPNLSKSHSVAGRILSRAARRCTKPSLAAMPRAGLAAH